MRAIGDIGQKQHHQNRIYANAERSGWRTDNCFQGVLLKIMFHRLSSTLLGIPEPRIDHEKCFRNHHENVTATNLRDPHEQLSARTNVLLSQELDAHYNGMRLRSSKMNWQQ